MFSGGGVDTQHPKLTRMTHATSPDGAVALAVPAQRQPISAAASSAALVPSAAGLPTDFGEQMRMAELVSRSDLVARALQGKPENVFLIIQKAQGLNISFDLALSQTHVIDNKVSPSAKLLRILLRRSGHDFEIHTIDDKRAAGTLRLAHRRGKPIEVEYTISEAQTAGLTGKSVWKQHVKSMLVASVTRRAVDWHCPEVAAGLDLDDDLFADDFDDLPSEPVRATAEVVTGAADSPAVDGELVEPTPDERGAEHAKQAKAKAVFAEALAAADVASLTRLGKEARKADLMSEIVTDDGATLKDALMGRLRQLETAGAEG